MRRARAPRARVVGNGDGGGGDSSIVAQGRPLCAAEPADPSRRAARGIKSPRSPPSLRIRCACARAVGLVIVTLCRVRLHELRPAHLLIVRPASVVPAIGCDQNMRAARSAVRRAGRRAASACLPRGFCRPPRSFRANASGCPREPRSGEHCRRRLFCACAQCYAAPHTARSAKIYLVL